MTDTFLNQLVAQAFGAYDVPAARATLDEYDLEARWSTENVAVLDAALEVLWQKAGKLKRDEAPKAERRAVRIEYDRLVNARNFLYALKPLQPGDVAVEPPPAGLTATGGTD